MNNIKYFLTRLAAKITGRKCSRCWYNRRGRCCHPDGRTFMRCWPSIRRTGFKDRREIAAAALRKLTLEEQHQLQRIKNALDEAEDHARESGLLED